MAALAPFGHVYPRERLLSALKAAGERKTARISLWVRDRRESRPRSGTNLADAEESALFIFINCEQYLVCEWCRSAPLFLGDRDRLVDHPVTLFFEDVQHLQQAGLFLKGLGDRK